MASLTARRRSFVAVQINLAVANTVYNVLDLINAVLAAETNMPTPPIVCPEACAHLSFQNDVANTVQVLLGDGLLSASRHGLALPLAAAAVNSLPVIFSSNMNNVQVGSWYAMATANDQKLHITVMTA